MGVTFKSILFCIFLVLVYAENRPSYFRRGDFYPRKGESKPRNSEVKSSGAIRDVIKRNSPRFRKVLVRNSNPNIRFATEDCRYMTSRGKSKLDVLATLVRSRQGDVLRVEKAWTDDVSKNDLQSLHYEGRAFSVKLASGNNNRLSDLAKLALDSGFAWIHYESDSFIHISVIPDVCQTKVDLAIVVDTSGSVGYRNFQLMQTFLKTLVDFFNVGNDQTHIALISYSSYVRVEFKLRDYHTKDELKRAIDRMQYQGQGTRTGDALLHLVNTIFKKGNGVRDNAAIPKIGIILTDGRSMGGTSVNSAAPRVKNAGINMFAVGITGNPRISEMRAIASSPFDEHYFPIAKFTDLSGFVDQISTVSCDEGAQISTCENAATSVDGGSFKYFRVPLQSSVRRVSVELIDTTGRSYLYTSLTLKNPGPLSTGIQKDESGTSPRTISVTLPYGKDNILFIAVQGQEEQNQFSISIWDSLFLNDRDTVTVKENQNQVHVKTVRTKSGSNIFEYSIKDGNSKGTFSIDKNTGVVKTTTSLDREKIARYQLSIVAQDKNEKCHKGLMVLVVNVGDENDNAPKFEKNYNARVREDTPPNQYVIQVKATDQDIGTNAELIYQISGPSAYKNVFQIDSKTGIVRTSQKLDYETKSTYDLTLRASDKGNPSKSTETKLRISVTDVNEPPIFTGPQCILSNTCLFRLAEEQAPGTPVTDKLITARDPDTKQGCTLSYKIISLDAQYFNIDTNGKITTKTRLDREVKEYYALDIEVSDCGTPKLSQVKTVRVQAIDINDNKPQFPYTSVKASIFENSNGEIYRFKATDRDIGDNGKVRYRISKNNGYNQFKIDTNTGALNVIQPLDREAIPSLKLEVTAYDLGKPTLSSTPIEVQITVKDVNDNNPQLKVLAQQQIAENVARNTLVFTANADDRDEGLNARIRYSIISGNVANMFRIDQNNGQVRTNGIPDRERIPSYTLKLRAQDYGSPSRQTEGSYNIKIIDENDNAPIFTNSRYAVKIKENTQPVKKILNIIAATDRDEGSNAEIKYSLVKGHDDVFTINTTTAVLSLVKNLDFGKKSYYEITVKAEDKGKPSLSGHTIVVVRIEDTNDFDPLFVTLKDVQLNENVPYHKLVTTVKATDKDSGISGEVIYEIQNQTPNENSFYINPNTGEIKTRNSIDYERTKKYELDLIVKDKGTPQRSTSSKLTVNIVDLNDNPPTFPQTVIQIPEDQNVGDEIKKLIAEDKDSGINAEVTFLMVTNNIPFLITPDGKIKTTNKLDRETRDSFVARIKVSDKGINPKSLSSESDVIIKISDVNDNDPKFIQISYSCNIKENSPLKSHVCYVKATDRDIGENARISYKLDSQTSDFSIEETTGEIKALKSFDREKTSSYQITIRAEDHGKIKRSSTVKVDIQVDDMNDNKPIFSPPYTYNFKEEQKDSSTVGRFIATDADIGKNSELIYSIVSGHLLGGKPRFTIEKDSKTKEAILKASKLDREVKDKYELVVKAMDNGNPRLSSETKVTINVLDINDNSPDFKQSTYRRTIKESVGTNTYVLKVEATDSDAGTNSQIIYSFKNGLHQDHFTLNPTTGEIHTAKPLDYETIKEYQFTIQAKDKGIPASTPDSATVIITVENVDDNAPEFNKFSTIKLPENTAIHHEFTRFKANDKDRSVLTYQIVGGNSENKFYLETKGFGDAKTVSMKIKNTLDRETTDKYNITVSASDSNYNVSVHVPIIVEDVNDNTPVFKKNPYVVSLAEGGSSSVILKVEATDRDLGINAEIEYSISKGNTNNKFAVNLKSGDIIVNEELDRESVSEYHLEVVARDKGTPSLASSVPVKVIVLDVNDNDPTFEKSPYQVKISENTNKNTKVVDIRATDPDEGTNGEVGYRIIKGYRSTFAINNNTGEMTTIKALDREKVPSYQLIVEAYDLGRPQRSARTTVSITILDINDNNPIIEASSKINNVNESSSVGLPIGNIQAKDADQGKNAELAYSIREEQNGAFFRIDSDSGKVYLQKKLDREAKETHNVTVIVEDKGSPVLRTEKKFIVQVLDDNDEKPTFNEASYSGQVDENVIADSLFVVKATDKDKGINAMITYSLIDDKNGIFAINQNGKVYMNKKVDFEVNPNFDLTIQAADWKFKTTVKAKVNIININDNFPIFSLPKYQQNIAENAVIKSPVLTVTANDVDPFGDLVYSITSNIPDLPFDINSNTGAITVSGKLDRETVNNYAFTVNATDNGVPKLSSQVNVNVTITDINDNTPKFLSYNLNVNLTENNAIGEKVFEVYATDADLGKNAEVRYRVIQNGGDNDFEIGLIDGVIKSKRSFDRENQAAATFKFEAYDLGSPELASEEVVLTVTILDENDNSPEWIEKNLKISIPENTPLGTQVKVVLASDADILENGRVSYSIIDPTNSPLNISADSGIVSISKLMDRELKDKYEVTLKASDNGKPSLSSTTKLTIVVTDMNDNAPMLKNPRTGRITENRLRGSKVVQLMADDKDLGVNSQIEFHLMNYLDLFELNIKSGEVKTLKPLDREEQETYFLKVRVNDKGKPRLYTDNNITITVGDVDDNCPVFESLEYKTTISENTTIGTTLLKVKATDRDTGPNAVLDYGVLQTNGGGAFGVDSDTGEIKVRGTIDKEYTNLYWLEIRAGRKDCGQKTNCGNVGEGGKPCVRNYTFATVYISITDINDNSPVFINGKDKILYSDINTKTIIQLNATDMDEGAGGQVNYRLVETKEKELEGNIENHVLVQAYDNGIGNSLSTDHVLIVVNKIKCDAMRFSIHATSGLVTVQSLCSISNLQQGDVTVLIGDSLNLTCEATTNLPNIQYRWLKDGTVISDGRSTGDLQLKNILHERKGTYACVASNEAGVIQSNPTNVIINEKPSIISEPKSITVGSGEPFTLSLKAKGVPDVSYQWHKNGKKITRATSSKFHFDNAILEDAAVYFCNISNSAGWMKSKTVKVGVFDKSTVVSVKVDINNPDPKKDCHYFFPEDFEKSTTKIITNKVVVTQVEGDGVKFCNITACSRKPCQNDGKCNLLQDGGYQCVCKAEWAGKNCETDFDECAIIGSSPCYEGGECGNRNGTFVCTCPDKFAGRRCEYLKNACESKPCKGASENCVPKEGGKHSCIQKSNEVTLVIDSNALSKMSEAEKKYFLEDLLKQMLINQQATTITTKRRRRRDIVTSIDYGACTVHIISTKIVNTTKTELKVAFDCSGAGNSTASPKSFVENICKQFLANPSLSAVNLEACGNQDKMEKPKEKKVKPVKVNVNVVVKDKDGKALDAKEAEKLMKKRGLDKNSGGDYKVTDPKPAYPEPTNEEPSDKTNTIIVAVVCAVLGVAIIVCVAAYLKRRGHTSEKQSLVMQQRSKHMTHDTSQSNLISRGVDIGGNASYEEEEEVVADSTFMFDMPTGLKTKENKESVKNLKWYYSEMSKLEVDNLLGQCNESGTYLLYKGEDENLTVAVKAPEGGPCTRHFTVKIINNKYQVQPGLSEAKEFSTLEKLADYYSAHTILFKEEEPDIVLKEALLKSAL